MGILTRAKETREQALYEGYWVEGKGGLFGSQMIPASTGITVTDQTALGLSVVHNCFRLLSEGVGSLTLCVYKNLKPRGKERAFNHPLYSILHDAVNPEMTSAEWREYQIACVLARGDGYSEIERDRLGDIKALWPLNPDKVSVKRGLPDGSDPTTKYYYYRANDKRDAILETNQVLQWTGLSYNGLTSLSVLGAAKEAMAMTLAMEQYGAGFFKRGSVPQGVLETDDVLGDEAADRVERTWFQAHGGLQAAHRVSVLEQGMKYKAIGLTNEDAQFLESRKFQIPELARFFNMPLAKIKELDQAKWKNVEFQQIEWVTDTLRPYLVKGEQRFKLTLFAGDKEHYAEFLIDSLLRGDRKTRTESLSKEWLNGNINNNEWREIENRNPRDGGEIYYVPANALPAAMDREAPVSKSARTIVRAAEEGELKSLTAARMRLRESYGRLIRQQVDRVVKRETQDVRAAAGKHLGNRSILSFETWLEEYYEGHKEYVTRELGPVIRSYAQDVAALAAEQVGADGTEYELEMAEMIEEYISELSGREAGRSLGQLKGLLSKSNNEEELGNAILQRLDEWEQTRAEKIEREEKVRANDAAATMLWALVGRRYIWVTWGVKPCPYCLELAGTEIGGGEFFVPAGTVLNPEEANYDMRVYGPKGHAPLHGGCVCTVEPV